MKVYKVITLLGLFAATAGTMNSMFFKDLEKDMDKTEETSSKHKKKTSKKVHKKDKKQKKSKHSQQKKQPLMVPKVKTAPTLQEAQILEDLDAV